MQTNDKHILSKLKLNEMFAAFYRVFLPSLILSLPLYFLGEYHHLSNIKFIQYTLANVAGNIINTLLWYFIIKKFDISYIAIIKTTQPFIFAVISFFILDEVLSKITILGLFAVILGSIFLEKSRLEKNKKFRFMKSGWPLILLQMIIAGIITNFSKMAVLETSPLIYIWLRYSIMSSIFYVLYKMKFNKRTMFKKGIQKIDKKYIFPASLSGILLLISTICEMYALKFLPISIVETITRFDLIILLIIEYKFITKRINKTRIASALLVMIGIILTSC
ncbi:MAG: EamA family transporter [Alphaproteobacteria bacterium]